jgi:hypothetical protein
VNNVTVKQAWIPQSVLTPLSEACYTVAHGPSHKLDLLKLLSGAAGDDGARAARAIFDLFWQTPIPDYFEAQTRDRCALWIDYTTIRYHQVGQPHSLVPWHFDFNFFQHDRTALIAWVPFDPAGEDAPGLDFALPLRPVPTENIARLFAGGRQPTTLDSPDDVLGPANTNLFTQVVGPGDVVLFDPYVLHRTQRLEHPTSNRLAVEFRMVSATKPSLRIRAEKRATLGLRAEDGTPIVRPYALVFPAA